MLRLLVTHTDFRIYRVVPCGLRRFNGSEEIFCGRVVRVGLASLDEKIR